VRIDVTAATAAGSASLVFQLLNGDGDDGSAVDIRNIADTVDAEGVLAGGSPTADDPFGPGAPLDLASLDVMPDVSARLSDVRLDPSSGRYTASLRVVNAGPPLGRDVAVVFTSLPPWASVVRPTGTNSNGTPYISMFDAIPEGGLGTGEMSSAVAITIAVPSLGRFALVPRILGRPLSPTT
jgi:hypothetical protein